MSSEFACGGITTSGTFGGWTLVDSDASKLPQDLASAIGIVFDDDNEKVTPIYYYGYQVVNGLNHCLILKRVRSRNGKTKIDYVTAVINIPPKINGYKEAKLVSKEVADETILSEEAQKAFDAKVKPLTGVGYTPLLEVGTQVVKGINYHIICQALTQYPDSIPYAVRIIINQFGEGYHSVEIRRID